MRAIRVCKWIVTLSVVVVCMPHPAAGQVTGQGLPDRYNGFMAASQANATGFGNHVYIQNEPGITEGNELDTLYVTTDGSDLWIGITGNLPNKLASGQTIVILMQTLADPGAPPWPNVLVTNNLTGYGSGYNAVFNLDGTVLDVGFYPDTIVAINRFAESTYVNSWYMPQLLQDPYYDDLTSLDPYNQPLCQSNPMFAAKCYISAWMDTTNVIGVDDDELKDGAVQQGSAEQALKGLRIRMDRGYFFIGQAIKMQAILMSPDGTVSNQILPSLSPTDDPPAPACLGPKPNFDETFDPVEDPPVAQVGYTGVQFVPIDLTVPDGGPTGYDGSDIPGQWPANTRRASQQIHTCFGNAIDGFLNYTIEGSELDEMFVRTDGEYLYVAVSGNLEGNCNKIALYIDADPNAGENTMDANSPVPPDATFIYGWMGRKFDGAAAPDWFAPEHAYYVTHCNPNVYIDHFRLTLADADVKVYLGNSIVNTGAGVLAGGTNPNNDEFALDHTNNAGVVGIGQPGAPGVPSTATTGMEAKIALSEIGVAFNSCANIKIMAVLTGGDGTYLSNQFLGSLAADTNYNLASEGTGAPKFDFGSTDSQVGGDLAFAGDQFVGVTLRRLGDIDPDVNCCINYADLLEFIEVLLGIETAPVKIYLANMDQIGGVDGNDIDEFVAAVVAEGVCP